MIRAAAVEIGQGVGTVLGTIAAEILDRPMTAVRYGEIDTDHTPLDTGTHVSFATAVTGRAIEQAAIDVRDQILEFASERLAVIAPSCCCLTGRFCAATSRFHCRRCSGNITGR